MISTNDKIDIKNKFSGKFYINGLNNYIDEIDSLYTNKYLTISIRVYYRKKKDIIDKDLIYRVLKRASSISNGKLINIYLLLTPFKKTFNPITKTNDYLSANNVNSGFTIINENNIYIFRKEEFPKVIIHEIIHHNKLIDSNIFKKKDKIKLCKHFKINYNCLLIFNETIIEFWAFIRHIEFISKEYNIDFNTLFEAELKYSLFKYNQIMNLQKKMHNSIWYDKCNIFSYIIFKTILLYNFNEFIKIYSFPYDINKIIDFIIKYSKNIPKNIKNTNNIINSNIHLYRPLNSLCFMLSSDL